MKSFKEFVVENFDAALKQKQSLEKEVDQASDRLQKYKDKKGNMGLIPDEIRTSKEYQKDKQAYDQAFQKLRAFNTKFLKTYKSEYAKYRRDKRG